MPPQVLNYASLPPAGIDLRAVARRQKWVIYCIAAYLTLVLSLPGAPSEDFDLVIQVFGLAIVVTAAVLVFLLAIAIYNPGVSAILGIVALVPLVGLFVLLVLSGSATRVLRKHGIRVGLIGASWRTIPPAPVAPIR